MKSIYVVTYVSSGMIAMPYAYTDKAAAEQAAKNLTGDNPKEFRVRTLEVK